MKKLKLFSIKARVYQRYSKGIRFAVMLFAFLMTGIGQVWGEEEVYKTALFGSSYNSKGVSSYTETWTSTNDGFTVSVANANNQNSDWDYIKIGRKNTASTGTIITEEAIDKAVTKVDLTIDAMAYSDKVTSIKLHISSDADSWTEAGTFTKAVGTQSVTLSSPAENLYYKVEVVCTGASKNGCIQISKVEFYAEKEVTSDPTVTAEPEEVTDVVAAGVTNQTIDLTYENIENYETEVSVHPNANGTGELSPAWLSASVSNTDNYATVTYSVAANEGAARTAYIKVYTTDGDKEATTIIPVSQVKYEAPFEGKILEINGNDFNTTSYAANNGDHTKNCVVYNTTAVMKNSNDIQFQKSNGLMYNKTDLGEIAKIEITKTGDYNLSVYEGTEEQPTTAVTSSISGNVYTYTFSNSNGYFKIKCGGTSLSKVNPIKVYYTPAAHAVTLSAGSNGTLTATVDAVAITSGDNVDMCKTVTISATPETGYKLKSLTVTDEDDEEVDVTNNQFVMPAKAVTIAAEFEATKTLTGIALTGEYPTVFLIGDAFSHAGMTVTANYDDETSADVTADATFTGYDMSAASAQTVTVSYTEGATVTKTYDITVKDAYTVTEILPLVPAQNAGSLATKVKGYISQIDQYNSTYHSITYWISDDGKTTSDQLEVYSGKNVGNTNFSSIDDLEVGDFVTITGNVKTHINGVKEFDKNNYIITGGRIQKGAVTSVAVSGNATKTTYSANETFETAGLVVTATYANGFSEVVTEGITWGDDLTDHKVTESTTVQVTATVGDVISAAYGVAIEVSTKALVSIALSADEFEVYQGLELPKPTVTATYSEGDPEDVTALAEFTGYNKNTPGEQTITVSYSFGTGDPIEETYTVTVKPIYNVELPASVAKTLIETVVGNTESTSDMIVRGIVSKVENISSGTLIYYISDDGTTTNHLEIFKGKYLNNADFTNANKLKVGDEVVVTGKVIFYNNSTAEFANGKSSVTSLARTPNFEVEAVTGFEVGTADLAVADLTITQDGEGAVTLENSDKEEFVTIEGGKLHAVATGTATITANLAADGIYKAKTATFDVTVIAAQVKYAITFDSNGADGGDAPEAIENKAAGAEVTLPANAYTKTGHTFDGWKVINNTTSEEVEVEAGAFTMPASAVTIQAQWAEISVWATTYTSNIGELIGGGNSYESTSKVVIGGTEYDARKVGSGSNTGTVTVTVPAGAHTLHFHAAAWNGKSTTITISGVTNISQATFNIDGDAGVKNSGTYTLAGNPIEQYHYVTFDAVVEETEIVFSYSSGDDKRFVLYGVNQEGGVLPASIAANPASISFGSVEQNASVAAKTINVTLTSVTSATVTLAGDDAFSIDKTSLTANGIIMVTPNTATIGAHNATITISDDEAAADDVVVNVSMTVTEPVINDDVTGTWNLVTDAADLMAGMQVIVASVADGEGNLYTLGGPNGNSANNRLVVASTASGDVLTPAVGTKVITLVDAGNGKYALQLLNGKYLYAQGGTSSNYLKERSDINDQATWTITFEEGKAIIKADVSGRNWIRYNKDNNPKIFSCYASGQQDIVLYAKPFDYTREIAQGVLSTTCLPNGGQIFGASVFEIAYMDYEADGTTPHKIYFDEVEGGIMEAGMPYVVLANEGAAKFGVYYTDNENKDAQSKNGLVGYIGTGRSLVENEYFIYDNKFFYVSADDATHGRIHISNNRAFINLSQVPGYQNEPVNVPAPGRRRVSLGNGASAPAVATGMENVQGDNVQSTKVLINGQLFILRGEKMYDATGRLVK